MSSYILSVRFGRKSSRQFKSTSRAIRSSILSSMKLKDLDLESSIDKENVFSELSAEGLKKRAQKQVPVLRDILCRPRQYGFSYNGGDYSKRRKAHFTVIKFSAAGFGNASLLRYYCRTFLCLIARHRVWFTFALFSQCRTDGLQWFSTAAKRWLPFPVF